MLLYASCQENKTAFWTNVFYSDNYEDKNNGAKLKGLPDEYLQTENKSIVSFDHKTKSKASEETHPSYQLQIHSGMDVQVDIIKVKTDPERVNKALKKASEILNGKLPKVNGTCKYCKWKELKIG